MSLASCKDINELKQETMKELIDYVEEIKKTNPEYSMIIVENELEQFKTLIDSKESKKELSSLTKEFKERIDNLTLSQEEEDYIKQNYCDNCRDYLDYFYPGFTASDAKINYYLGEYNGKHFVIIDTDRISLSPAGYYFYPMSFITFGYEFLYFPQRISVHYDSNYYRLGDPYLENGILSNSEMDLIYEVYNIILEYEYKIGNTFIQDTISPIPPLVSN